MDGWDGLGGEMDGWMGWTSWRDGGDGWDGMDWVNGWMIKQMDNLIAAISFPELPKIFYHVVLRITINN